MKNTTREQWLMRFTKALAPLFKQAGETIPEVLVSISFPHKGGTRRRNRTIGQCWTPTKKIPQIFISPLLKDSIEIGATLAHELVHAVVGCEYGHKGPFKRVARSIGLEGKLTAAHAGPELLAKLQSILDKIGPCPHEALSANMGDKKQSTRLLKVSCPKCGYIARVTGKWIEEVGPPTCTLCKVQFEEG